MKSVAVIGASLAGLSAARALRDQGFDGELTIVGGEALRPYDRPPLSKEFLAGTVGENDLALESDDEDLQATWLLGVHATALDAAAGVVALDDGTSIHADGVVVATGARARSWPGSEHLAGVHVLRTIDDALALRADLRPGARLVVIGAGFIGAEVASTATKLGLDVTVVEAAPAPLAGPLGERLGAAVARLARRHGTRLFCGIGVAGLTGGRPRHRGPVGRRPHLARRRRRGRHRRGAQHRVAARTADWSSATACVCGAGGETAIPNVVAVGDCAAWHDACHRAGPSRRALDRRAGTTRRSRSPPCSPAGATRAPRQAALLLVRPVRLPHPVRGPRPARTTRSPSRKAAATSTASSPPTDATAAWSRCSASTNRACSPAGVVNWPPRPPALTPDLTIDADRNDPRGVHEQMTSAPSLPESLISTLAGHYYTDPAVFALEQEKIFETMWFCAVRAADLDKPGAFKTVQVGPGERPGHQVAQGRRPRLLQRLPASRRAVVHRGQRRGQARVPMPLPRVDIRPRRQADRGAESDQDARHRPGRVRTAPRSR